MQSMSRASSNRFLNSCSVPIKGGLFFFDTFGTVIPGNLTPALTLAQARRRMLRMSSPQLAKKRVLVVDDDRTLRHALVTLLEGAGFSATPAGDGASALTQIRRHPFDL